MTLPQEYPAAEQRVTNVAHPLGVELIQLNRIRTDRFAPASQLALHKVKAAFLVKP